MNQLNLIMVVAVFTAIFCFGCAHDRTVTGVDKPPVGIWFEESQLTQGQWTRPSEPIQELRFDRNGFFSVTWHSFESYMDYWGRYTVQPATGELVLTVDGENYLPADFVGKGQFTVDEQGRLVLSEICLGTPKGLDAAPHHATRFNRSQP